MSNNSTSNNENELRAFRRAQTLSESQHHVDTKEIQGNTQQILSNTWRTNRLLTLTACCAAVSIALLVASGCNVTSASERDKRPEHLANTNTNLRRIVEHSIWCSEACGRRLETGQMIKIADVESYAQQIVSHPQFKWEMRFTHPVFRGYTISGLADSHTLIGQELRKLRDSEQ